MQNIASRDEVTRWTLESVFCWGVGLIASLSAARCNCSLNNHLSGVASPSFSAGLHSVLSCSEAGPTRTVAFLCLPGRLHQPLHQGWLLETFLSQRYIHLMWSRPVSQTLTGREKRGVSLLDELDSNTGAQSTWALNYTPQTRGYSGPRWHSSLVGLSRANPQLCHCEVIQAPLPAGYASSRCNPLFSCNEGDFFWSLKKDLNPERGLFLFTQHLKLLSCYLYRNHFIRGKKKSLFMTPTVTQE